MGVDRRERNSGADPRARTAAPTRRAFVERLLGLASVAVAGALLALVVPAVARADAFVPPGLLGKAKDNPRDAFNVVVVGLPDKTSGNKLGHVKREYRRLFRGVASKLTGAQLVDLADDASVRSITPDAPVIASGFSYRPKELWPLAVRANELWGQSVDWGWGAFYVAPPPAPTIAVIDSGVDEGVVGARVVGSTLICSLCANNARGDDYGHGTLVAALAASTQNDYPGVAPNADLLSVRVMDANGMAMTSDVIAAAEWVYKKRDQYDVGVVNLSLHSAYPSYGLSDPLNLAVRRLWLAGLVVVTAAGNSGAERMLHAPASDPFVITVGATDIAQTTIAADDFNAPWTSHGYTAEGFLKPELGAPGRYMVGPVPPSATLVATFPDRVVKNGYIWMSGTSFAAPVVAGAAAQILARHPDWTPGQVKGALMVSARPLALAEPMSVGVGEIDAAAAAALAEAPDANAALESFVTVDPVTNEPAFDAASWARMASADASWARASWANASWANASWANASWANASWSAAAYADATWADASWANASWAGASWAGASWAATTWVE